MTALRRPSAAALLLLLAVPTLLRAAEVVPPPPLPTLPPEERSMLFAPPAQPKRPAAATGPDQQQALIDDIKALKAAVERVRGVLPKEVVAEADAATTRQEAGAEGGGGGARTPDGPPREATRLGTDQLVVQRYSDGSAEITATIDRQPLDLIVKELAQLLGRSVDDAQATGMTRRVSLSVSKLATEDALDRLLGAAGLAWREEGPARTLVLIDPGQHPLSTEQLERLADRALNRAARERGSPQAAQALFLIARRHSVAKRQVEAMGLYSTIVEEYGSNHDPAIRPWVARAVRGIGDAMVELGQFRDARDVYLNYISRAGEQDPELPAVYLAAAEAGRRAGLAKNDPIAFDESADLLHSLLERYAESSPAAAQVHEARLALGELLVDAGRWQEAEIQLKLVAADAGGAVGDQVVFWLAECAYHLDHPKEAQPGFEKLYLAWKAGHTDPQVKAADYATSGFRIGQCWLMGKDPQYVRALFALLRARQDFPKSPLEGEVLIAIARCYAELQRDDDTVAALADLLKSEGIADPAKRQLWLDQSLEDLGSHLGEYSGPVRAKVLFYMGQADYRRAQRDRAQREAAATDAVHHYEQALTENPPSDLAHAAQLGLARAALLGGQEEAALKALKGLLRDPTLAPRDREFAAQLLGNHLRDQGRFREAIQAFRGEVAE